jgi:hypothetical protein
MNATRLLKITISADEIFRWRKGTCLRATEQSSFIIPGAIFRKGEKIGDILELSDDDTDVVLLDKPKQDTFPNMAVILKPGSTMRLNRNCEVKHIHLEGEEKHAKQFIVIEK